MAASKAHKDLSKETLTARLRDASKAPVAFVFALSKAGKDHYLVLHKVKAGKSLLTFVRGKQPDAGKAAYGTARLTPTALVLDCEKELPGMATAAKVWVATNKNPKVKKIKVLVGGQEVAEEGEQDTGGAPDADAEMLAKLKGAVTGRFADALEAAPPKQAGAMKKLLAAASKRDKAGDVQGAIEAFRALAGLLGKGGKATPSAKGAPADADIKQALAGWQSARKKAVGQLSSLAKAIAATKEPEAKRLLILLKAIQANLTESPTTPRQVAELERYMKTDDIIADAETPNPFGIVVSVRKPLLAALAPLKDALGAD